MKRTAFSIFTVLLALLIPAALMAQTETNLQESNEEQLRTNPDAESWGPGQGLTITGTVESVNEEAIQIRTTTGIQNIVLGDDTQKPVNLQVGDEVAVDYLRNTQGVMIAQQIRPAGTVGAEGDVDVETEPMGTTGTTAGTMETDRDLDTDLDVEVGAEAETGIADVDVTRERETDTMALQNEQDTMNQGTTYDQDQGTTYDQGTLPATASNLPALALLGLLAFAGAIAIRTGLR